MHKSRCLVLMLCGLLPIGGGVMAENYKTTKLNGQTYVEFATGSFVIKESLTRRRMEYLVEIVENDLAESDKLGLAKTASIKSRQILNCATEQVTIVDAEWRSKPFGSGDILQKKQFNRILPNESANQTAKRRLFGFVCA